MGDKGGDMGFDIDEEAVRSMMKTTADAEEAAAALKSRAKFSSMDRLLYGWQKWIGRSHPKEEPDKEDYKLRKTIIRLQKQSLESAANRAAKETMLPWDRLLNLWRKDGTEVNCHRQLQPLKDVSDKPQTCGQPLPPARHWADFVRFKRSLFGGLADGSDEDWLTARMAARLCLVLTSLGQMALNNNEWHTLQSRLPHFARPFLQDSHKHDDWRPKLAHCFETCADRLRCGKPPDPVSTGQEVAMHVAIGLAEEWNKFDYFSAAGIDGELPAHPNDSNWKMARENAYDVKSISVMYELGIANPDLVGRMLPVSSYLHPTQWFVNKNQQHKPRQMSVARRLPCRPKIAPMTVKHSAYHARSVGADAILMVPDQKHQFALRKQREKEAMRGVVQPSYVGKAKRIRAQPLRAK